MALTQKINVQLMVITIQNYKKYGLALTLQCLNLGIFYKYIL